MADPFTPLDNPELTNPVLGQEPSLRSRRIMGEVARANRFDPNATEGRSVPLEEGGLVEAARRTGVGTVRTTVFPGTPAATTATFLQPGQAVAQATAGPQAGRAAGMTAGGPVRVAPAKPAAPTAAPTPTAAEDTERDALVVREERAAKFKEAVEAGAAKRPRFVSPRDKLRADSVGVSDSTGAMLLYAAHAGKSANPEDREALGKVVDVFLGKSNAQVTQADLEAAERASNTKGWHQTTNTKRMAQLHAAIVDKRNRDVTAAQGEINAVLAKGITDPAKWNDEIEAVAAKYPMVDGIVRAVARRAMPEALLKVEAAQAVGAEGVRQEEAQIQRLQERADELNKPAYKRYLMGQGAKPEEADAEIAKIRDGAESEDSYRAWQSMEDSGAIIIGPDGKPFHNTLGKAERSAQLKAKAERDAKLQIGTGIRAYTPQEVDDAIMSSYGVSDAAMRFRRESAVRPPDQLTDEIASAVKGAQAVKTPTAGSMSRVLGYATEAHEDGADIETAVRSALRRAVEDNLIEGVSAEQAWGLYRQGVLDRMKATYDAEIKAGEEAVAISYANTVKGVEEMAGKVNLPAETPGSRATYASHLLALQGSLTKGGEKPPLANIIKSAVANEMRSMLRSGDPATASAMEGLLAMGEMGSFGDMSIAAPQLAALWQNIEGRFEQAYAEYEASVVETERARVRKEREKRDKVEAAYKREMGLAPEDRLSFDLPVERALDVGNDRYVWAADTAIYSAMERARAEGASPAEWDYFLDTMPRSHVVARVSGGEGYAVQQQLPIKAVGMDEGTAAGRIHDIARQEIALDLLTGKNAEIAQRIGTDQLAIARKAGWFDPTKTKEDLYAMFKSRFGDMLGDMDAQPALAALALAFQNGMEAKRQDYIMAAYAHATNEASRVAIKQMRDLVTAIHVTALDMAGSFLTRQTAEERAGMGTADLLEAMVSEYALLAGASGTSLAAATLTNELRGGALRDDLDAMRKRLSESKEGNVESVMATIDSMGRGDDLTAEDRKTIDRIAKSIDDLYDLALMPKSRTLQRGAGAISAVRTTLQPLTENPYSRATDKEMQRARARMLQEGT